MKQFLRWLVIIPLMVSMLSVSVLADQASPSVPVASNVNVPLYGQSAVDWNLIYAASPTLRNVNYPVSADYTAQYLGEHNNSDFLDYRSKLDDGWHSAVFYCPASPVDPDNPPPYVSSFDYSHTWVIAFVSDKPMRLVSVPQDLSDDLYHAGCFMLMFDPDCHMRCYIWSFTLNSDGSVVGGSPFFNFWPSQSGPKYPIDERYLNGTYGKYKYMMLPASSWAWDNMESQHYNWIFRYFGALGWQSWGLCMTPAYMHQIAGDSLAAYDTPFSDTSYLGNAIQTKDQPHPLGFLGSQDLINYYSDGSVSFFGANSNDFLNGNYAPPLFVNLWNFVTAPTSLTKPQKLTFEYDDKTYTFLDPDWLDSHIEVIRTIIVVSWAISMVLFAVKQIVACFGHDAPDLPISDDAE